MSIAVICAEVTAANLWNSNGPGSARNADFTHAESPPLAAAWQAAQAVLACCADSSPGLISRQRNGPPSASNRAAAVSASTKSVTTPRLDLRLRTGWHFAIGRLQAPFGNGPSSQGPPYSLERVQR